ncbi:MAG: hypothetical protein GY822_27695 [Deltaproteobacteria bacterium]|nr:hypothetical protein [Deltaproteobacteria bacterium]
MTSLFFSACVGDVLVCECVVCIEDGAVLLSVEDSTGNEVEDFVVELVLNEVSVGQPANCTPEERDGSNSCTFGSELGFYHIIVTAPGYERRELAVRVFDEGQREVCCRACLSAREVTVSLQPR